MTYRSLLEDDEIQNKQPVKKQQTGYVSLLDEEEIVEPPSPSPAPKPKDPYAGLNPLEQLAVAVHENPVTNTIANATKDFTRGALRVGGGLASGVAALNQLNPIAPEIMKKAPMQVSNFAKTLSENNYLKSPDTEITKQLQQGNIKQAGQAFIKDPLSVLPTIGKFSVENLPTALAAGATGGVTLYPEMIGYSYDRLVNEHGVEPQRAALIATGEGLIAGKLEKVMGAVPVFKKLLTGEASKEAAKKEIKTLMQKGTSIATGAVKTGLEEGLLEEPSQQILANFADNLAGVKTPLLQGVPEAAAMGFLAGLGLGAGGHLATNMQYQEKPLQKLPRAELSVDAQIIPKQQGMSIMDIEPNAFTPTPENQIDSEILNQEYSGLEQSELIRQRMEEESQWVALLQDDRAEILGQIQNKYGDVHGLRKALMDGTAQAEDADLLNSLVENERELMAYGAIEDFASTSPGTSEVSRMQDSFNNISTKPVTAGQAPLQGQVDFIDSVPDEGVEYYRPKNQQRQSVPDKFRLYAENANQFESYEKWRDSLKSELSKEEYEEFRDELKSAGFHGLKNFYKKRQNVKPVPAEIPQFDYQDKQLPQVVQQASQSENIDIGSEIRVVDKTAQREIFNPKKTGLPVYDRAIEDNDPSVTVEYMTPDEYIDMASRGQYSAIDEEFRDQSFEDFKKSVIEFRASNREKLDNLKKLTQEGVQLDMPVLEYYRDGRYRDQEGYNRAIIAKELGIEQIPVMISNKPIQEATNARNIELPAAKTELPINTEIPTAKENLQVGEPTENLEEAGREGIGNVVRNANKQQPVTAKGQVEVYKNGEKIGEGYWNGKEYKGGRVFVGNSEFKDVELLTPSTEYSINGIKKGWINFNGEEGYWNGKVYNGNEIYINNSVYKIKEGDLIKNIDSKGTESINNERSKEFKSIYRLKKDYDNLQNEGYSDGNYNPYNDAITYKEYGQIKSYEREIRKLQGKGLLPNGFDGVFKNGQQMLVDTSTVGRDEKQQNLGYNDVTNEDTKDGQSSSTQNDRKRIGNSRPETVSESDTGNEGGQGLADSESNELNERTELDQTGTDRLDSSNDGGLTPEDKALVEKEYKNRAQLNTAIKKWIASKGYENYVVLPEALKTWLKKYTGAGGVKGAEGSGILDEYYTPEKLVKKMWDLAKSYTSGNRVFEPSMGIGRFFEFAPQGYDLNGAEIDSTSGKIAQLLYPDSAIKIRAFQETFLREDGRLMPDAENPEIGKYDIVIGNPPYKPNEGKYKAIDNKNKAGRLEEYFIDRGLDLLKDGGVLVYVIPRGILNNASSNVKEAIAKKGKLVDAYRLPDGIFQDTGVGTDVIVIRKEPGQIEDFVNGNFFKNNPEKILGELSDKKGQWGSDIYTGDISALDKINIVEKPTRKEKVLKQPKNNTSEKISNKKATSNKSNTQNTSQVAPQEVKYTEYQPENKMSEAEKVIWQSMDNDNAVDLPINHSPELLNYYDGKVLHNVHYLDGNLYLKLEQLEKEKAEITEEQYNKQKKLIERNLIKQSVNEFTIDPLSKFGKSLMSGKTIKDKKSIYKNNRWQMVDYERETSVLEEFKPFLESSSTEDREGFDVTDLETLLEGKEPFPLTSPKKDWEGKTIPLTKEQIKYNQRQIERQAKSRTVLEKIFNDFVRKELPESTIKNIEDKFNREFNAVSKQDLMSIPLLVKGMSDTFKGKKLELQWQQLKGINFLTTKGTGCLAYGTGIGKTITGIIATVQNMQMGRCKRPVFVVPANTLKKWIFETRELFPNIKINNLGNMGVDVEKIDIEDGSLTFITHEAFTNLWYKDPAIIEQMKDEAYSQSTRPEILGMIPEKDSQRKQKQRALDKAASFISEALSATNNSKRKELFYVDELGFDHVTVDETHLLFTKSVFEGKTGRQDVVRGTQGGTSKSGAGMFLLHQYILGNNNYRNAFHLTATPFENRIIEIYNMLSYVGRYRLAQMGLLNTHDFIDYFIDVEARQVPTNDMSDIKTEKQVRAFKNAGVFKRLIAEFIDYESSAESNKPDKHTITVELNKSPVQEARSKEAKKTAERMKAAGGKEGKAAALIYMGKERLNNLSPYLAEIPKSTEKEARKKYLQEITPKQFVEDSPKILYAVESIAQVLKDDPETSQILYMDTGVDFFGHIKKYIVERGILKANEIVTTEETNDKQKIADMLNDRNHPVKLLIGSSKISTGMDLQENTSVLYNLSNDYNPTTQVQVEGRIWRQGNPYKNVRIVYPFIKNSSDVFMFRILADKTARLNDIYDLSDGDNYIDVEEVHPDKYIEQLITDPDLKYAVYIDSQRSILEQKRENLKDKIVSLDRMEREYNGAKAMLKANEKALPEREKDLEEWKAKVKEKPDYNWYKEKYEEAKDKVSDAKYYIKRSKEKIAFWDKRMQLNKVDINNIDSEKEAIKKEILSIENELNNIEANAEIKKQEFRQQYIEEQEKAPSMEELIKDVKELNKSLLEKDPEKVATLKQRYNARRGSIYVGPMNWQLIKNNIVKSFKSLQMAMKEFIKFSFNPGRYMIALANNQYHIVRKTNVKVNSPKYIDTYPMQDLVSRMHTILKKNKHTWQTYLDSKEHERELSNYLNKHRELLLNVERNMGEKISDLIDYVEGNKPIPVSQKQNVEIIKDFLYKQGLRVLDRLIKAGYLKPVTKFIKGRGTEVYTPDGQTLIGEAFGKKDIDKIFRQYMEKTWIKENYFPHVFKGFYPVLAHKTDGSKHFIGRATSTIDAKKVYADYIKENPDKSGNFTGNVTLDIELSRDDNEYVLVGLPDLKRIKDRLNDENLELELTSGEITEILSTFVPKRDVKKARRVGHSFQREGYEGYVKDPIEALEAYIFRTEKFIQDSIFLEKATSNMTRAKLEGIQSKQKNLYEQTLAYIKAVTGERYADEKFFSEMTKAVFEKLGMANSIDYNWYPKFMKAIRSFEYKAKLGIRLDHLIIQPALLFTNVYPELSAVGQNQADGEKYTYIGIEKSARSLTDKKMREILKESQIFDAGFIESMEESVKDNSLLKKIELSQLRWKSGNKSKSIKTGLEIIGDLWMLSFSIGDKIPRAVAFWGRFQQILDKKGIKDFASIPQDEQSRIIRSAADFSDYTNHKYSIVDAPALFRSQTGKTLLQFKQFMVFQLGLWKDMLMRDSKIAINAIRTKDFKKLLKATPILKSMLLTMLIFGITGIPFAQDISDLFEKAFKVNPVMEARKSDFIRAGVPSLVGIDLAASGDVRLQSIVPVDWDKWTVNVSKIAPVFSTGKNIKDFLEKVGSGNDVIEETGTALKREFPAVRRIVEGKAGFKTIESSRESFKTWEYSRVNSRKMRRLVQYSLNGENDKFKDLAINIAKSGYYKDAKSMERGFNSIKGLMRKAEFVKIKEAVQKKDKNRALKLRQEVVEKFYKGDAGQFDNDFLRYYKQYAKGGGE